MSKQWSSNDWLKWQQKVIREEMKDLKGNKHEAVRK